MNHQTLREGVAEQGRVIYALLLREIRARYSRHRIGYAWAFVEPMLHLGMLYGLRSLLGGLAPQHLPLLLWLMTGIIPFFLFRGIVTRAVGAAKGNADVLILAPIKMMDIVWSRVLLENVNSMSILLFYVLLYAFIVEPVTVGNPLGVFGCMLLLAWLGMGLGMICLSITSVFPSVQPLIQGMLRILYFSSGVMFTLTRMPLELQPYLMLNPVLHTLELLRAAFFESYQTVPSVSLNYALAYALIQWIVGAMLMKRCHRAITEE